MGGRGGASGRGGGGSGGSRAGGGAGRVVNEQTFKASDLKTELGRTGEYNLYNSQVGDYSEGVVNSLNPGDSVTIEKTFKDGTVQSATLTMQQPQQRTWRNGTSTEIGATKTGSLQLGSSDTSRYFSSASNLARDITNQRSKVRSVKVTVRKRR